MTMSSLTGFFGFHNDVTGSYIDKNADLLSTGINSTTHHYIIDTLAKIPKTRNDLFHKNNLTKWNEVIEARNCALNVFYLFLGSYRINKSELYALGMLNSASHDDFYKLCEYVETRLHTFDSNAKRPIFYLDSHDEPENCWIAIDDNSIEYDEYGEPKYSGIYFISHRDKERKIITADNIPTEIWEGIWDFSGSVPNRHGQSGPIKKLFENGKFLLQN